jgi:hypothetical protein
MVFSRSTHQLRPLYRVGGNYCDLRGAALRRKAAELLFGCPVEFAGID